jgi:hypothetical protein
MDCWNKSLKALKAAIAEECAARMQDDHSLNVGDVAKWLLANNQFLVEGALRDLTCQVMEQRNDDERVERILSQRPELSEEVSIFRVVSEALGVATWYLLRADDETTRSAFEAAELIHRLRGAELQAQADAMKHHGELLAPIMDGHPDMTVGEAERLLKAQTDATIRELEG